MKENGRKCRKMEFFLSLDAVFSVATFSAFFFSF